jgi:hypothetical protein
LSYDGGIQSAFTLSLLNLHHCKLLNTYSGFQSLIHFYPDLTGDTPVQPLLATKKKINPKAVVVFLPSFQLSVPHPTLPFLYFSRVSTLVDTQLH